MPVQVRFTQLSPNVHTELLLTCPRLYFFCRHESPAPSAPTSAKQSITDRYHGRNDSVANRLLRDNAAQAGLTPPEDESIVRSCSPSYPPVTSPDVSRFLALFCRRPSSSSPSLLRAKTAFAQRSRQRSLPSPPWTSSRSSTFLHQVSALLA